jgi:lipopolysaccharide biosynthesis glycosyltransferase
MNIVSTSFSLKQIGHGEYFLRKIIDTSIDIVDKVIIWNFDLGFKNNIEEQINNKLNREFVKIITFPREVYRLYPEYFKLPKQFSWTPAVWWFSRQYGDNILWMDADKPPITSLDKVFKLIEEEEIFAGSGYGEGEFIKNWTHEECKRQMNITEEIGNKRMIHAGTVGYKKNGKYDGLFKEAYEWSKIKEVIQGQKSIHARDQAVLATLIAKTDYKLKMLTSDESVRPIIRTYWYDKPLESDIILKIERFK